MAAVGRKNWRIERPAVSLSASVAPATQQADQHQHVVAVPEGRPEAPDPGQQHPDDERPRAGTSPRARRSRPRRRRAPSCVDRLEVRGVDAVAAADDDLALEDRHDDRCRRRPRRQPRACSVRSSLNEELGTSSGPMSAAPSIRSASLRPPAMRPAEPGPCLGHLGVAAAPCSRVASRTRAASGADRRPSAAASRPISVVERRRVEAGTAVSRKRRALLVGQLRGRTPCRCAGPGSRTRAAARRRWRWPCRS